MRPLVRLVITLALVATGASPYLQAQGVVRIRMGTIVPKGSLWDESLQYVRQEWRKDLRRHRPGHDLFGRRARRRDGDGPADPSGSHSSRRALIWRAVTD